MYRALRTWARPPGQRRQQRQRSDDAHTLDAVEQLALAREVSIDVLVDVMLQRLELAIEHLEHLSDTACSSGISLLQALGLGHAHVHQLAPAGHEIGQFAAVLVHDVGDETRTLRMVVQHMREVAQRPCVQAVSLGQHAHGLGKVPGLARVDPRDGQAGLLQCQHDATFVATAGFEHDQVDRGGREGGNQFLPPPGIVTHAQYLIAPASIQMLLGDVDTSCATRLARRPALQIHAHDGQLFGLTVRGEIGRCVDRVLRYEIWSSREGLVWRTATKTGRVEDTRGVGAKRRPPQ